MKLTTRIELGRVPKQGEYVIDERDDLKRLEFSCPGCGAYLAVERKLIDDQDNPGQKKWVGWEVVDFNTLTARASILHPTPDGCGWHGYLTDGEFTPC